MKKYCFFFFALLGLNAFFGNDVYDLIRPLPFDPAGYFAAEKSLDKIFKENEIKTVIEIGSWAGASTRFFGHRVGENGKVYAIDHWLGTENHPGEQTDPRLSHIYQLFLSNIMHAGLTERVVPIRMSSDEAAKALQDIKVDLVYIDARRDAGVYEDIIYWYHSLNESGIMCGTEFREPAVRQGVLHAAQELNQQVETDRKGFFWVFIPK